MIQLRTFREQDLYDIGARLDMTVPDFDVTSMIYAAVNGFTYTFMNKEAPAAIVGGNILWPGVCQVWAVISDKIRKHGIYLTKATDEILRQGAIKHNIRRYHCIVHGGTQENVRWLYSLHFEYEYSMYRAAPDGADILGYVRWEENYGRRRRRAPAKLQTIVGELLGLVS